MPTRCVTPPSTSTKFRPPKFRRTCCSSPSTSWTAKPLRGWLSPEPLGGEPRALDQGAKLGPGDLRMHASAEAAVRPGDDIVAADCAGETHDPLGDQLRVLDQIGGVADDARQQYFAI